MRVFFVCFLGLTVCVPSLRADQTVSHQAGLDFARLRQKEAADEGALSESVASDIIPSYTRDPGEMTESHPAVQETAPLIRERVQEQLSGPRMHLDPNTDPMFVNATRAVENPEETLKKQTVTSAEDTDTTEQTCVETRDEEFEVVTRCSMDPFYKRFEVSQFYNHCPNHSGWGKTIAKGCVTWRRPDLLHPARNPGADYEEVHGVDWKTEAPAGFEDLFQSGKCRLKRETPQEEGRASRMIPVDFYTKEETRTDWSITKIDDHREGRNRLKRPEDFGVESFQKIQVFVCSYQSPGNTCQVLRQRGGMEMTSTCTERLGTVCVKWQKVYKVPKAGTLKTQTTDLTEGHVAAFNSDGHENDTSYADNTEGPEAMAKLSALRDVGAALPKIDTGNPHDLAAFAGEDRRCVRQAGNNRCPGGRGNKTADDQLLEKKVNEGKCIKVGTYEEKSKRNIGIMIGQKRQVTTFACYDSVLSKTLHQGALDQGIKGLGNPQSPNCGPLTLGQIQALNWDSIDFTPFVQETLSKVDLDAASVAQKSAMTVKTHLFHQMEAAKRARIQGGGNP